MSKAKKQVKAKKHRKLNKPCRVALICAAAVLLCILIFTAAINVLMTTKYRASIYEKDNLDSIEGAEYAIILGCGVYENGEVCDMLRHRLDVGAELYFSGKVQKIIVSGNPSESHNNEPHAMRIYLTGKGIPDSAILTDNGGISTYDTMSRASEVFGVKSAVVVSQRYHLSRAMYIGDSCKISVSGASATFGKYENQSWYSLREYLARCKDFFALLFDMPYDNTAAYLPEAETGQSPLPEPTPTPDLEPEPEPEPEPEDFTKDDDSGIKNSDFVRVKDHIPSIFVDIRYAGTNNPLGDKIYNYSDAYLRYGTVRKLKAIQNELLASGLSLKIWDAYRPLDAQSDLAILLPTLATNPTTGFTQFNYGDTVSITIVKSNGDLIDMPSDFDAGGSKADRNFSDVSKAAAEGGKLLDDLMKKYGFEQYLSAKWYRYSDSAIYTISPETSINQNGLYTISDKWEIESYSKVTVYTVSANKKACGTLSDGASVTPIFFYRTYVYIKYGSKYGLVSSDQIISSDKKYYSNDLKYVSAKDKYSYKNMVADANELADNYSDVVTLSSIGKSEEGRDIVLLLVGNPNAKINILVQASMHAREYITTTVLMAQVDYMLKNLDVEYEDSGYTFRELLDEVCFHILPMINPDGVQIVQTGVISPLYTGSILGVNTSDWKANAKGVDLNSNFNALWQKKALRDDENGPAPSGYEGESPECAAESRALANYLREHPIDITISYHTSGSIVYWDFEDCDKTSDLSKSLYAEMNDKLKYVLYSDPTSCAGFRDWTMLRGIPSLTIEFGAGTSPSKFREFYTMWARGKDILYDAAIWALENRKSLPWYNKTFTPEYEECVEVMLGTVTADKLNVRSGAGTKYSSLGTLKKGDAVTIVGTSGGWHKIKFRGREGYVSADYIELKYNADPSEHVIYDGAVADLFPIAKSYSLPRENAIEYVILHFSSAIKRDFDDPYNMDLIRDIFLDEGVDAHYVIDRDGTVYCLVPEDRVAYHASSMNGSSIGIELLAIGSKDDMSIYMSGEEYDKIDPSLIGYTEEQYASLDALLSDLCERYEIPADREHIAGHDEYNSNKNDPGELFDWERVMDSLNS